MVVAVHSKINEKMRASRHLLDSDIFRLIWVSMIHALTHLHSPILSIWHRKELFLFYFNNQIFTTLYLFYTVEKKGTGGDGRGSDLTVSKRMNQRKREEIERERWERTKTGEIPIKKGGKKSTWCSKIWLSTNSLTTAECLHSVLFFNASVMLGSVKFIQSIQTDAKKHTRFEYKK